ncbi:MAG: hypothetical protein ACI3ZZ_06980 [Candidatus Aphodosoma sp.]
MRKLIFYVPILLSVVLLCISCRGASSNKSENNGGNTDSAEMEIQSLSATDEILFSHKSIKEYIPLLENYSKFMSGRSDEIIDGFYGIDELRNINDEEIMSWNEVRNVVGFTLLDVDGDGINELIIGTEKDNGGGNKSTLVLALYKLRDGTPELVFSYTARNAWYYLKHDGFLNIASEGASCSIAALYSFVSGDWTCDHYWFSAMTDAGSIAYYHSYAPTLDPAEATLLNFTTADFNSHIDNLFDRAEVLNITPFAVLRPINATYEDGKMHLTTNVAVKDFHILALSDWDFVDDKMTFKEKELKAYPKIEPGEEIVVEMPFIGDIPQYAISFVDPLGNTVKMDITISGYDGSILLTQY